MHDKHLDVHNLCCTDAVSPTDNLLLVSRIYKGLHEEDILYEREIEANGTRVIHEQHRACRVMREVTQSLGFLLWGQPPA